MTSIVDEAFSNCSGITSVVIPNSVTSIGNNAFSGCVGITSVTIGNNVTSIGKGAFSSCTNMTSLTIGNGVESIKQYAFSHCKNLMSIIVLGAPNHIEEGIFLNCSNINEVIFDSEEVTQLLRGSPIKKLSLTDKVTTIGDNAFRECKELTYVTIPNNVTSIGESAFNGCKNLASVTFGSGLLGLGQYSFSGCNLTSIDIPGNVKTIGVGAFYGCSNLTSVILNEGVEHVGFRAFERCNKLKGSFHFPSSIRTIDGFAFCDSFFSTIYVDSQIPPNIIDKSQKSSTFSTISYPYQLYVPRGTVDKYKAANGWKDFRYIDENPNSTNLQEINSKYEIKTIYSLNGVKLQTPSKGINIIKMKDGTVKKVFVK